MRIALLSPIAWRTPPLQYGPWEQVVSCLAEGLVAQGIDVTLFATGNSVTAGKLDYCIDLPYADNPQADAKVNECLHISYLMEKAGEFDLIHNHFDFLPLTYSRLVKTPMLTTIHGFSSPRIVPVYKKYNDTVAYVSISNADRQPTLDYIATVYNGIATAQFSLVAKPGDYLLFFGRIHPEKGAKEAIQTARAAGKKIIIAGLIQDQAYFDAHVAPFVNGDDVVYAGNCGPAERNRLLGNALGLLHLISFDEPFGLSVAEAMCCGTPVIAINRGAMPELIEHEKTGFLVHSVEEAIAAVANLPAINRTYCRQRAIERFSAERMTQDYIQVYKQLLKA
ncbi:MAG TPA: glycosyltransferase family 4 protein [Chitinophagaceae bacterium]|nr:glycosyltransferase family 4 protein [Chitinophagaceae bacterium]